MGTVSGSADPVHAAAGLAAEVAAAAQQQQQQGSQQQQPSHAVPATQQQTLQWVPMQWRRTGVDRYGVCGSGVLLNLEGSVSSGRGVEPLLPWQALWGMAPCISGHDGLCHLHGG